MARAIFIADSKDGRIRDVNAASQDILSTVAFRPECESHCGILLKVRNII
jgi:hypothetical protein